MAAVPADLHDACWMVSQQYLDCAGFFFGRTPLIKLSPKKTWEGFFGGLVLTVVSSWYLAEFMSRYKWMICPRTVSPSQDPPI